MTTEVPAARPQCDHHWAFHIRGGEPLSVGICTLCGEPNWDDLRRQMSELNGATQPGPEDSYPSTPGEFAARWNSKTDEQRSEWLVGSVSNAEKAMLCRIKHGWRHRMTSPIERAMEAVQRAVTVSPEDLEQLPQRFASGGYIEGSPVPIAIDPHECFITAANVRAGRLVCFRAGHPTHTSACHTTPGGEH